MNSGSTKVWKDGRLQDASQDAALASLCQAVEKAVRQHQTAGVRAVILMMDQPAKPEPTFAEATVGKPTFAEVAGPAVAPAPVYVDVFESGYSHDSGYGHGI
jgi:hypothetical protein